MFLLDQLGTIDASPPGAVLIKEVVGDSGYSER